MGDLPDSATAAVTFSKPSCRFFREVSPLTSVGIEPVQKLLALARSEPQPRLVPDEVPARVDYLPKFTHTLYRPNVEPSRSLRRLSADEANERQISRDRKQKRGRLSAPPQS